MLDMPENQARRTKAATEPVEEFEWLKLKAPGDFWQRLDRWREHYKLKEKTVMAPTRPAAIRWIVHQFLLKQEQAQGQHKRRVTHGRAGSVSRPR
jgi:hypothetical protein